jgi:MYXO-CTERM domain-containing protein
LHICRLTKMAASPTICHMVGRRALLVVVLVGGCRAGAKESAESKHSALVFSGRTAQLDLVVPAGTDVAGFVLAANGALLVDDRAVVSASMSNLGSSGTNVGADAHTASIWTASTLTLRDRAIVTGAINTTVAISAMTTSHVSGVTNTHATLVPPAVHTLFVSYPAGDAIDINLEPSQSSAPSPGRYGALTVKFGAHVHLRSGTYYLESLDVEPQGFMDLDERSGPVVIYVNQPFIFRGTITTNLLGPTDLMIAVLGSGALTIESPFQGTVVAPHAHLSLGIGGSKHTGAFFAQDIEVQPGVTISFHPSAAIPRCDDGNACTGRDVLQAGRCVGQDPAVLGVPESDPAAPRCSNGALPVGCRAYDCSSGLSTGTWLAKPVCGSTPACVATCPVAGCKASEPRTHSLVSCSCLCTDPTGGPSFSVTVNGCGTSDPVACSTLCVVANDGCGSDSSCSFGSCRPASPASPNILAGNACRTDEAFAISTLSDYVANVDGSQSSISISVGGASTTVALGGTIGAQLEAPSASAPNGRLVLSRIGVSTTGSFSLFGRTISQARFDSKNRISAVASSPSSGKLTATFSSGSFGQKITAIVNGTAASFDALGLQGLQATLDLPKRLIDLRASGTLPSGDNAAIHIVARLANLPPIPRVQLGASQPIECNKPGGVDVVLDGTGSTDPENQALRYQWFSFFPGSIDNSLKAVGFSNKTVARLPVGTNTVRLIVYDPQLAAGRSEMNVIVVDTTPPTIQPIQTMIFHAGESTSRAVALNLPHATDACDPAVKFRAFRLEVEPDSGLLRRVPVDPKQVILRVGTSTIVWQAVDAAGNTVESTQTVQVLAGGSPADDPPPDTVAATCAEPLNVPGPATPPVELRVCVVGRVEGGLRVGSSLWSSCPNNDGGDAADTCTANNIQALLTQANELFAPAVQFNFVGWRRIRDPRFTPGTPDSKGQYGKVFLDCTHPGLCSPVSDMHNGCYQAWGVPPPGSRGDPAFPNDHCTRGITVLFVSTTGAAFTAAGVGQSSDTADSPFDPTRIGPQCDFSQIGTETYDPIVVVGQPTVGVTAHELGHALGLPHGNGIDDDCNGVWDEDPWNCDLGEAAADRNASNQNLMNWTAIPGDTVVTDIQRGVVRTFALHSVPTAGTFGANCLAADPAIPPDDTAVLPEPPPSDGGIVVVGGDGGPPPTVTTSGCSCRVSGQSTLPTVPLAFIGLVVARRRRRKP